MEAMNMIPVFPIMGLLMGLLGRILLAISLCYIGKGLWLWLIFMRRR